MSDFEFMRDLPLGQYLPGDLLVHRLDPRTRILTATAFMLALTFTPNTAGLVIGLVAALGAWALAGLSPKPAWRGWRAALPFSLILAVLQVFFHVGPNEGAVLWVVGPKAITVMDLLAGVNLILRFSAYIAALGLASSVLSSSEMTRGLEAILRPLRWVGLPVHDFVMVVQVTLRFFPLLAQTAERIAKAQASRGADWEAKGNLLKRIRQIVPLLVPLFVTSLRRAENMALAMDARAYGSGPERSSMVILKMNTKDWLALFITGGTIAAMFWL